MVAKTITKLHHLSCVSIYYNCLGCDTMTVMCLFYDVIFGLSKHVLNRGSLRAIPVGVLLLFGANNNVGQAMITSSQGYATRILRNNEHM